MIDLFPLARPFIHALDPERAHSLTVSALSKGLSSNIGMSQSYKRLRTNVFGLNFDNPIGLAAGFDKDAEAISGALKLGFGFVEAGTVTPKAQPGNPKPRLFRLSADRAVINRFGFNNKGMDAFAGRLQNLRRPTCAGGGIVGANVGANKNTDDKAADYVACIDRLYGLSDYFTINVSSPNTPGLRSLQSKSALEDLVGRCLAVRKEHVAQGAVSIPILLKIAPDLTSDDIEDIAASVIGMDLDGLIVSNTTIARPKSLKSGDKNEAGGLSGAPLMKPSTEMLRSMYVATKGQKPIIGVGGVQTAADAYEKIRAGASLVQIYSAMVYQGPGMVERLKRELNQLLARDGHKTVSDAVGADHI